MSRRKQSNPKPAKRDPCEVPPSLAACPELPVYLKKFGGESLVLAKDVLKAGTVLGTYKGTPVLEEESSPVEEATLKVNRSDGGSPVHVMLEDEGHWLKLMRTAAKPTDANICLRISGRDIVCTVTKDVNKEVELKVTCRIADPCYEKKLESSPENLKSPQASKHAEVELEEREAVSKDCTSPKIMLDCISNSLCTYSESVTRSSCLNSREVSEERSVNSESDIDMDDFKAEVSSSTTQESPSSDPCKEKRTKPEDEESSHLPKSSEFEARKRKLNDDNSPQTSPSHDMSNSESYPHDKTAYSHNSPHSARNASCLTNPKSFCDACKIQFMSVNTYHVHKKFYCKSRHENEDIIESMPVLEAASGGLSAAFKPSSDTVILRNNSMNGGIGSSVIQPQAIYAAISTNPLILLPCTLVPGQGLVPQNGILPAPGSGILLQGGIACPTIVDKSAVSKSTDCKCPPRKTSHPSMNSSAENDSALLSSPKVSILKRKVSEGDVLNLKKQCTSNEHVAVDPEKNTPDSEDTIIDQNSPLDLSLKTKKVGDAVHRKSPIRRRNSVISTSQPHSPNLRSSGPATPPGTSVISSVHSVPSPTNSYNNENSSFTSQVPVVVQRVSERISPLPPVLQSAAVDKPIPTPGMLPPKLMKQGNNICEECHIVFIKYDNLVTHKKHYCAYRRRQLSALAAAAAAAAQDQSSDDNNSNHSSGEGAQNFHPDDPVKPVGVRKLEYGIEHYRQVIPKTQQPAYCCDACGVKFSTSDTLVAHQTYYCMKKPDSAMAKANAKKGDESSSNDVESPFSGPEEWKCNYCDATCSSYETIRRHLLTHSEPRGYRCVVCGYKGNTLRGMRTHACDHLTEDTTSIEEFMSNTVISEVGGIPIIPRPLECSDEDSDTQNVKIHTQRERTSSNNSDSFKDNNLKPTTDHSDSEELSNSPRSVENFKHDTVLKAISAIKSETGDSNSGTSGNPDPVNPLAFCDVVIKTENDHIDTDDDSDRNESRNEQDLDADERFSASARLLSVIRVAEQREDLSYTSKRKCKPQSKSNSDLKFCKSCGVSFQHLSNLVTHKKYYCVSRSLQNRLPETTTVQ